MKVMKVLFILFIIGSLGWMGWNVGLIWPRMEVEKSYKTIDPNTGKFTYTRKMNVWYNFEIIYSKRTYNITEEQYNQLEVQDSIIFEQIKQQLKHK